MQNYGINFIPSVLFFTAFFLLPCAIPIQHNASVSALPGSSAPRRTTHYVFCSLHRSGEKRNTKREERSQKKRNQKSEETKPEERREANRENVCHFQPNFHFYTPILYFTGRIAIFVDASKGQAIDSFPEDGLYEEKACRGRRRT